MRYKFLGEMATANPDEADYTCKNPDCPKGVFKWNTILKHVDRAMKCKIFYNDAEIEELRGNSKELQKRKESKRKMFRNAKKVAIKKCWADFYNFRKSPES